MGVECIVLPASKNRNIDSKKITHALYKKGIKKILVEGGKTVITSFLKAGLADKMIVIIAPKVLGEGVAAVGDLGIARIKGALKLHLKNVKRLGKDIIYTASL